MASLASSMVNASRLVFLAEDLLRHVVDMNWFMP